MTDLQRIEFEMLKLFVQICKDLNLTYYLVCGSALGAIKYQGFIPWDDDIDVALPRKDYEIFVREAQARLPDWCFLQNYHTQSQFYLLGSKLRDSRTTYVEQMCGGLDIHHGVFIDVFPLDGLSFRSAKERRCFERKKRVFDSKRRVRLQYRRYAPCNILSARTNFYYLLYRVFGKNGDTSRTIADYERLVSAYPTDTSEIWCNHANSVSAVEYAPRSQYGDGAWASFEGLRVRVPEQYDAYLTQKYGRWRDDLPPEQQVGHHHYELCDLARPYTYYMKGNKKHEKDM